MAQVKVSQTATSVGKDSLLWELVVVVNALATAVNALTAKLDADTGVADANYASTIGTQNTLTFREGGTPS